MSVRTVLIAASASAPLQVTLIRLPWEAARVRRPIILFALTRWPLRLISTSLSKGNTACTSAAAGRACIPSEFMMTISSVISGITRIVSLATPFHTPLCGWLWRSRCEVVKPSICAYDRMTSRGNTRTAPLTFFLIIIIQNFDSAHNVSGDFAPRCLVGGFVVSAIEARALSRPVGHTSDKGVKTRIPYFGFGTETRCNT